MVVRLQCGCCKVQLWDGGSNVVSKVHVRLKYGKSIVLHGNFFWRLLHVCELLTKQVLKINCLCIIRGTMYI